MQLGKNYKIKNLPTSIEIMSIHYTIEYHELPNQVDIENRRSLFGQTDPWDRTIRIYYTKRNLEDIFMTLLHEIFHILIGEMEIKTFNKSIGEEEESVINLLSLGIFNVFYRNNFLTFPSNKKGNKS